MQSTPARTPRPSRSVRSSLRWLLPLAVALPAASCGSSSSGDSGSFVLRTTDHAVDATSRQVVAGLWMIYFADEGTSAAFPGVDLNGDGDTDDDVAVVAQMAQAKETVLRAAVDATAVGNEIYLVVDEAVDGMDWDGDLALDDLVLLHWSQAADAVTFVDLLDPASTTTGTPLLALEGQRVYYASATAPSGDETTLRYVDRLDPLVPVTVENFLGGGALAPLILGKVEGLIFLLLDETTGPSPLVPGPPLVDYNLDGDDTDTAVLALLDGTDEDATVVHMKVAMSDADAPFDARGAVLTGGEWLVACLVNENAQGATNLNDQALFANPLLPDTCGVSDPDTDDDVLFYARYDDLAAGGDAVNTGLAGIDRVIAVQDYVATLSPEADAFCDFNGDLDTTDSMVRWVEAIDPLVEDLAPPRDPSQLFAAHTGIAGESFGLSSLEQRFVMVVDEAADAADINGDTDMDDTLVGFLEPTDGFTADWVFSHPTGNPGIGLGPTGGNYAGVNWMADEEREGRLGLALMEEVFGFTVNVDLFCDEVDGGKDADAADSLPIWADFESGPVLDFDGQGYAIVESDPGLVQARGFAFYRVSETADNFDYNQDGDLNDAILFRNPQTQCATVAMATASLLAGDNPVIVTDGVNGAVFLASEFAADLDFNGDGDLNDLVPRYFLF